MNKKWFWVSLVIVLALGTGYQLWFGGRRIAARVSSHFWERKITVVGRQLEISGEPYDPSKDPWDPLWIPPWNRVSPEAEK
jgi:hypothetical protein